jgi:hypothetical protein
MTPRLSTHVSPTPTLHYLSTISSPTSIPLQTLTLPSRPSPFIIAPCRPSLARPLASLPLLLAVSKPSDASLQRWSLLLTPGLILLFFFLYPVLCSAGAFSLVCAGFIVIPARMCVLLCVVMRFRMKFRLLSFVPLLQDCLIPIFVCFKERNDKFGIVRL